MRIHLMTKGKLVKKKPKVIGGAVKQKNLFSEQGRSALEKLLKPKTPQKYISFS